MRASNWIRALALNLGLWYHLYAKLASWVCESEALELYLIAVLHFQFATFIMIVAARRKIASVSENFHRRPQSRATMGKFSVCVEEDDRNPQSHATMGSYSVCMEEDKTRSQSLARRRAYSEYLGYERRFQSSSGMGRILLVTVLLAALAALVVGAVKILVWLVHLCGTIHVRVGLPDFYDAATTLRMLVLLVVGISLTLLIFFYGGLWVIGFMGYGIAAGSYAAIWMSSIGSVVAGSLFPLLQMIAMGGISVFSVLHYIVACVALVVGAFQIIVWFVPYAAMHAPTWLVDSWDSSTAWVLHVWDSVEISGWWNGFVVGLHNFWDSATAWLHNSLDSIEIFGWWHSFVAWLHNSWDSIEIFGWWHSFVAWLHNSLDSIEIFGWWHSFVAWLHNSWDSIEIFGWWHSFVTWLHNSWDSIEIFGWWHSFVAWLHNSWDSIEIFGWWHSFVAWLHNSWDSIEIFGWWHSFVAWLHNSWDSITYHQKWKIYT